MPAFISKTRALAEQLPESEKAILLVEREARLIQAAKAEGTLPAGLGIQFIGNASDYYVKIKPEYTLKLSSNLSDNASNMVIKGINGVVENKGGEVSRHRLTQADKTELINRYQVNYPELTLADIPDEVELVSGISSSNENNGTELTIRFVVGNRHYWIATKEVFHLQGKNGQLNSSINYWNHFPLSLTNLPAATEHNTVYYPRTVSLNEQSSNTSFTAVDDAAPDSVWRYIQAGNKQGMPIQGWVNTKSGAQQHIKRVSPWHWSGFKTIEEKATVGELSDKISKNNVAALDLADYTPTMRELQQILTGTLIYSTQRKKDLPPPTFTDRDLKEGLRRSWTAEQIGHLLVKYESEWYADEGLSKWNEVDELFEEEKQQQKALIEAGLDKLGITLPYQRDFTMKKVDEAHEHVKSNWQLEKEERINPLFCIKQSIIIQRIINLV
ncbi:hypothetical protein A9G33_00585 [Gilliamella sp. Choc3-5]|nr:hypothetical protein [Gilliamella apicola]OCG33686.1 hypothetical protein A9G33_00585 [Gilliamella apicola]